MKYLLDTDICIFFLKNKFKVKEKIIEAGVENCFLSEITIAELKYGAQKSSNFKKHSKEVEKIEKLFSILPIYGSLDLFAEEKVILQKQGNLIPDFDLLIGVTSIANDLILVTNNEKHLHRIQNIKIENWKKPAFNEYLNF